MKRPAGPAGLGASYNFRMSRPLLILAALALSGCASAPAPSDPARVRVYESVTGAPPVAGVVKRLWVESRMTALVFPSYRSAEEGAERLRQAAARLGGDGIVNFGCYRMSDAADAALRCNGTVVRFK